MVGLWYQLFFPTCSTQCAVLLCNIDLAKFPSSAQKMQATSSEC